MRNIKLTIEYDGKEYNGWQKQPNKLNIQGEIERAIQNVTGKQVDLIGSGRTDAGVNAYGQVANFKIESEFPIEKMATAINSQLKKSICVKRAEEVPLEFHSRYNCHSKTYNYVIDNSEQGTAIYRNLTYHVSQKLNIKNMQEAVKYFGISFETISPSYYPLECNLIEQLTYFTGDEILFDSTFTSNDKFKNYFIQLTSSKTFTEIELCCDQILELEEEILRLNNKFYSYDERCNKVDKIVAKQDTLKKKITDTYLKAQDSLIKGYFDKAFKNISNLEELDNYRKKLDHYGNLIGRTDDYTFFDDYYTEKMSQLEHKSNVLENGGIETALTIKKPTKVGSWFRAFINFVTGDKIHN